MTQPNKRHRFGRVTIDDRGICQRRWLLFFGQRFSHSWSAIEAWSSTESVIRDSGSGTERVDRLILELRTSGRVDFVVRKPSDPEYAQIVDKVRQYVPDLEGQSLLSVVRPSSSDDQSSHNTQE